MTTYKIGDIVLMGFPHSDLKHVAKRPAVVLYDAGDEDVLVAKVTARNMFHKRITSLRIGKAVG